VEGVRGEGEGELRVSYPEEEKNDCKNKITTYQTAGNILQYSTDVRSSDCLTLGHQSLK
jgi:hypothetical protein